MYWAHGVAGDKKVMHGWQGVGAGTTQVELPDHGGARKETSCRDRNREYFILVQSDECGYLCGSEPRCVD